MILNLVEMLLVPKYIFLDPQGNPCRHRLQKKLHVDNVAHAQIEPMQVGD